MSINSESVHAQPVQITATWTKLLWPLWVLLVAGGVFGIYLRLIHGHNMAGYGSYVPWGLWIGVYFVGVGISGGSFVLGSLGYLFGIQGFSERSELRTAIILSLAGLFPAFLGVWLDLGRMDRMMNILIHPSFTSMMAFNAWMYNIFVVVAIVSWILSFSKQNALLKPFLVMGIFLSILFPSQSGVFFEAVRTNEFWNSPLLSMLFFVSAITLGGASLLFVRAAGAARNASANQTWNLDSALRVLRTVTILGLIIYVVFEFAEFSIVFWNPGAHSPQVEFLLFGDYWLVFWGVHLIIGVFIPLLLMASKNRGLWVVASFLAVIGFGAARMCILIPGQVIPQLPGIQEAFQDPRLSFTYHITTMEYLVVLLMIAVGMAIFYIGSLLSKSIESGVSHG